MKQLDMKGLNMKKHLKSFMFTLWVPWKQWLWKPVKTKTVFKWLNIEIMKEYF